MWPWAGQSTLIWSVPLCGRATIVLLSTTMCAAPNSCGDWTTGCGHILLHLWHLESTWWMGIKSTHTYSMYSTCHCWRVWTYSDSCFSEVGPHCYLLSGAHVRIAVPLEGCLQLLELLAGEVRPLSPLLFLERSIICAGLIQLVLLRFLCVYRTM